MDPLREEYTEVDTWVRCPHCGAKAWFPRQQTLAAAIVCPEESCARTFVWDRWVSREDGVDRAAYLHPRVPGFLASMMQRSWEITGLGVCLLVFAVPLVQAGLGNVVTKVFATLYFTGMGLSAVALATLQRRGNRMLAANKASTRTHVLERSPTIHAVATGGWAPVRMLQPAQGNTSSKQASQRKPSAV